jgi:hypothetical protein
MRFDPPKCPTCGELPKGTAEETPGIALLDFDEDGDAEYSGETTMLWENQTTVTDEDGKVTLVCPDGHDWQAEMVTS